MINVFLTAGVFASITLAIILYASTVSVRNRERKDKLFSLFVLSSLILVIADTITWILDGNMRLIAFNYAATYITIVCAFPTVYLFARYLIAIIERYHPFSALQKRVLDIYTVLATLAATVMCLCGGVFTLVEGHYATGRLYLPYICMVVSMYIYMLFTAMVNFQYIGKYERTTFYIYSLSPIVTLALEFFVDGLSISYSMSAISTLFIYVLLQSEDRIEALDREKELLKRSNTDE